MVLILGHAAGAPRRRRRRRRPPHTLSRAAFLNLALTSIPGVPIGRHGGPPAKPIGRAAGRGLAGKFDFDRFTRPIVTCKCTRTHARARLRGPLARAHSPQSLFPSIAFAGIPNY